MYKTHFFTQIITLKSGVCLIHKARDLGCFTSSPQATPRSPNYNYNGAKTMPIDACHGIYKLKLTYHSPLESINYTQYNAQDNGYQELTQSDEH